jgi:hypothetical protein
MVCWQPECLKLVKFLNILYIILDFQIQFKLEIVDVEPHALFLVMMEHIFDVKLEAFC